MRVAILTSDDREQPKYSEAPHPLFGTAVSALLQGLQSVSGVEVHVISCVRRETHPAEKLAHNIWYHPVVVPTSGWLRTLYQGCIRAMRRKLREIRPDIVHGQGTERECALAASFSGYPNVITIHGNMRRIARLNKPRPLSYLWIAAKLEAITLPRTGGVVCITNYTREAVSGLAKKTWVVPNAVDASFFEVTPSQAPATADTILCVGNVSLTKNQNAFIQAITPLAERRKVTVLFFGGTKRGQSYDDEFFRLLAQRPWCVHGGFADYGRIRESLGQSTFLALPSLEDNCPMAVLEAMAAGAPVLAAKVGGVPDLIDHERTGLLCNPLDPTDMAQQVDRLLADQPLRQRLAAAAKAEALRRFHPNVIAQSHMEIYREVLR